MGEFIAEDDQAPEAEDDFPFWFEVLDHGIQWPLLHRGGVALSATSCNHAALYHKFLGGWRHEVMIPDLHSQHGENKAKNGDEKFK